MAERGGNEKEGADKKIGLISRESYLVFHFWVCEQGSAHAALLEMCAVVGGEGNLDVREMSDKGLAYLALSLHILKRELVFPRFALHDLNMSSVRFPPNE